MVKKNIDSDEEYKYEYNSKNSIKTYIKKNKKYTKILEKYNNTEIEYFSKLNDKEKDNIKKIEDELNKDELLKTNQPLRFKILLLNTTLINKFSILNKYEQLNRLSPLSSEYYKLYNWIETILKVPLGKYYKLPISCDNKLKDISKYLINIKKELNNNIYGHIDAKEQIIRIISQFISFPEAKGYIIGIQGSMGVGKTRLIKEGICKALNYPFSFISLGGISESCYLKGHSFTYEGSKSGKIVECLTKSQVMNPIIFFDELDKVSDTKLGEEIINTLIHITDSTQNEKFTDRYFEEIDFDISKSIIFFSYNDEKLINPILKDRMITINVKGYNINDKIIIARNYLIKEILLEYNLNIDDIIFSDDIIKEIINLTEEEEGVRNLQRNINNIVSHINLYKYMPKDNIINFPYKITVKNCNELCKKKNTEKLSMYL